MGATLVSNTGTILELSTMASKDCAQHLLRQLSLSRVQSWSVSLLPKRKIPERHYLQLSSRYGHRSQNRIEMLTNSGVLANQPFLYRIVTHCRYTCALG